jgi:hypothetical protein
MIGLVIDASERATLDGQRATLIKEEKVRTCHFEQGEGSRRRRQLRPFEIPSKSRRQRHLL